MKHYEHLTDALRAILLMATRGYKYAVIAEVPAEKVQAIATKWVDAYGTTLPAWKRHARKSVGLCNAWACSMPVPGSPHRRFLVLMRTECDLSKLDAKSPWLRERWRDVSQVEVLDFVITVDRRDRRDYAWTVRLSPRALRGIESFYRELAGRSLHDLAERIAHDCRYYPMFGGVRRQLRRLIRGYAKLYEKKLGRPWPGPDPESLPHVGQFKQVGGL